MNCSSTCLSLAHLNKLVCRGQGCGKGVNLRTNFFLVSARVLRLFSGSKETLELLFLSMLEFYSLT